MNWDENMIELDVESSAFSFFSKKRNLIYSSLFDIETATGKYGLKVVRPAVPPFRANGASLHVISTM